MREWINFARTITAYAIGESPMQIFLELLNRGTRESETSLWEWWKMLSAENGDAAEERHLSHHGLYQSTIELTGGADDTACVLSEGFTDVHFLGAYLGCQGLVLFPTHGWIPGARASLYSRGRPGGPLLWRPVADDCQADRWKLSAGLSCNHTQCDGWAAVVGG